MNYHGKMMNIQVDGGHPDSSKLLYLSGHRAARHAAAEIANEADARISELEAENARLRKVADAAAKFIEASDAWKRFNMDGSRDHLWHEKFEAIVTEQTETRQALGATVREYQKELPLTPLATNQESEVRMTEEEIDKMEAGREFDALIAEYLFGARWFVSETGDRVLLPRDKQSPPNWTPATGLEPRYHSFGLDILDYSTEIAAAWMVVEKLRARWVVILEAAPKWHSVEVVSDEGTPSYYRAIAGAEADAMPLAVCRAALKAVLQQNLPQNYHNDEPAGTYHDKLKSAMTPITENMPDGE